MTQRDSEKGNSKLFILRETGKSVLTSNWFRHYSIEKFNTLNVIYEHQLTDGFKKFLNNRRMGEK